MHMQLPYAMFKQSAQDKADYYAAVYRSFDELEEYAKASGVRIAQENLFYTPNEDEDEKFDRMFNRYSDDYMGLCYDSGHATLSCLDNYYYYIEKYNKRIMALHLQDSNSIEASMLETLRSICDRGLTEGIKAAPPELKDNLGSLAGYDVHNLPFTGVLDWDRIARNVAQAPLVHLPADFEVMYRGDIGPEEAAWLRDACEKAKKFHEMVLKYRT
jgi:sugar phosphate isomerase/epimerase